VFWQITCRLREKKTSSARSIDTNGVLLSNEEGILGRWTKHFKYLLNTVTIALLETQEVHLGEENTITPVEVLLAEHGRLQAVVGGGRGTTKNGAPLMTSSYFKHF